MPDSPRPRLIGAGILAFLLLAAGVWWWSRNHLVEIPLASDADYYEPSDPGFGRDEVTLEVLLPEGPKLQAFMRRQVGETLVGRGLDGKLVGLVADQFLGSSNLRHWRIHVKPGVRRHDGAVADAAWLLEAIRNLPSGPFTGADPAVGTVKDPATLDLDFKEGVDLGKMLLDEEALLLTGQGVQAVGTGPFQFQAVGGNPGLVRNIDFRQGKAGFTALKVATDPALRESAPWAAAMAAGRYAWSIFPGGIDAKDMAKVRMLPYQEVRFRDGTVLFVNTRLRRFRTNRRDWSKVRLYSIWVGDLNMPLELDRP
ncbi:MAG TPA: hypothetical protein VJ483_05500 [Holophagaceae bacterium]|nr:hypothetical protein [Holophagaceae bacterium]